MNALQLFNEILYVVTFFVLIAAMGIMSVVALLRYRMESYRLEAHERRLVALEQQKP